MVFAGNLENGGKSVCKLVDSVSYLLGKLCHCQFFHPTPLNYSRHMLIYQDYADIFPFFCEPVEGVFDLGFLCLCIADEEVLLRVRRLCDMTSACEKEACDRARRGCE